MKFSRAFLSLAVATTFLSSAAGAKADDTIRILCPTWSGYAPIFVAADLGYFKAMGLTVNIKFDDERADVMAAMARGDIEMDLRTVGEYQGRPRDETTPGVIIGTIDESLGGDGVIADGSIKSIADLKGKVVASELNIPGRLLLQLDLKKHGMTLKDLQLKEIATADTVSVFADKSVSAVVSYEPYLSQAKKVDAFRNPTEIVSSAKYPGYIVDVIIVRADDLKANPAKYRNFLIGIYKAINYYNTDPTDFIKLAAPHFNLSPADFKASIDGSLVYTSLAQTKGEIGTTAKPGSLYGVFNTLMGLNLENGAATTKLSATKAIDNSVITKISASDLK
ncbi:MAG: myristoyl transferase [Acidocella sp. 20-57-95]|nr:MAG: myristoyl transferase [Acidocella sp. 20-57-95]OYV59815.1 MAG: myristoyl transferase [Acidocella sp. 21-58-7]HQT62907.1 ABC transporter substrate-binding protein [Acidocella sp.]